MPPLASFVNDRHDNPEHLQAVFTTLLELELIEEQATARDEKTEDDDCDHEQESLNDRAPLVFRLTTIAFGGAQGVPGDENRENSTRHARRDLPQR